MLSVSLANMADCKNKKKRFFQKRAFFEFVNINWPRGANIGASLRRPNPREFMQILFFYKIVFKMGAALSRDAIWA